MYHCLSVTRHQIMCVASFLITLLIWCQCDATSSSSVHPAAIASSSSSFPPVVLPSLQHVRSRPLLHSLLPVAPPSNEHPAHRSGPQVLGPRRSGAEARNSLEQLSPKRFFDFLTDPSLLITVLHSLEVAYWTFPFGFILTPVINFFRLRKSAQFPVLLMTTITRHQSLNSPLMQSLPTWFIILTVFFISAVISIASAGETPVKREEDGEDGGDADASESRAVKDKRYRKKTPTITIPIKNAVVQALAPVERHSAEAASHKPSRDSYDDPGGYGGVVGDIVYEDELPGDLEGWIPPPPPPPETLFRRPSFHSPHSPFASSTFTRLASMRPNFSSARLFGDDFALFLVILTIAGFFGLMLAMFMPFTFLMNQQPVGIGVAPYPYGQVSSGPSSVYGYPYGRKRRSAGSDHARLLEESGSVDFFLRLLMQAMEKYDGQSSNNRNKSWLNAGLSPDSDPLLWELATTTPSASPSPLSSSSSASFAAVSPPRVSQT